VEHSAEVHYLICSNVAEFAEIILCSDLAPVSINLQNTKSEEDQADCINHQLQNTSSQ
jgi:hypothetical protein